MNLKYVVKAGFFLPVLSLVDSTVTYAITQMINAFAMAFPKTIPSVSFTMQIIILLMGVIIGLITLKDYFEDFGQGWQYPTKSLIYGGFGIAGLWYFWTPLSNMYPASLGSGVIWSTIITIIILISSSVISLFINK